MASFLDQHRRHRPLDQLKCDGFVTQARICQRRLLVGRNRRGARDLLEIRAALHSAERQADYRPERALVILAESLVNPVTGRRNTLGQ